LNTYLSDIAENPASFSYDPDRSLAYVFRCHHANLDGMTYTRTTRLIVVALLAVGLSAVLGCSFSKSSKSISNSISSPFRSSSASSKSDAAHYREEVADYAQGFVTGGGGEVSSFQRGLAGIAEKRGISDWESNEDTWKSLGVGLGRTEVTDASFAGFVESWAGGDSTRSDQMREGFESER
jgi:hypothetical protein